MEDALAPNDMDGKYFTDRVLILVLMEDALARTCKDAEVKNFESLNPCFNGRCTRTPRINITSALDNSLNPCFNGRCTRTKSSRAFTTEEISVLILVLMEDALARG